MIYAAQEVFTSHGYAGARMTDIAAEAGVGVQTVYFTFHTKAELLQACYELAVLLTASGILNHQVAGRGALGHLPIVYRPASRDPRCRFGDVLRFSIHLKHVNSRHGPFQICAQTMTHLTALAKVQNRSDRPPRGPIHGSGASDRTIDSE